MRLSVKVETGSEDTVFVCRGEISKFEASDYLFNLITRPGRNNVVLDFAGVTGIDEHGLAVLAWGRKILLAARRKLLLRIASGEVLKHLPRELRIFSGGGLIQPAQAAAVQPTQN